MSLQLSQAMPTTNKRRRIEDEDEDEDGQRIQRPRSTIHDQHSSSSEKSPKEHHVNKNLKMVCASFYLPKDNDRKPLGEDAHFVCADAETIGVADGVGGWARRGVDAGEYARELMSNASLAVLLEAPVDPGRVVREAYRRTRASGVEGSSTACVVAHSGGVLRWANVGDSGFMIFRRKRFLCRSRTQQRGFNHPYQLGSSRGCDGPGAAAEAEIAVAAGDVVVLGTDGFLDNVFPSEVEEVLDGKVLAAATAREGGGTTCSAAALACIAAETALYNSFDRFRESPFSAAARRAGKHHRGGKIDDITVVVGLIVDSAADQAH